MYRIVRYITLVAMIAISTMLLTGCNQKNNPFVPKTQFYGTIKDAVQWRLAVPNPANQADIHVLDPGQYFSCELEGSRQYHFEAKLPDSTTYAAFDARINQLSGDAPINGVNVDWCWIIGGSFYAAVTPVDSSTELSVSIEIINFSTGVTGNNAPTVQTFTNKGAMIRAMGTSPTLKEVK